MEIKFLYNLKENIKIKAIDTLGMIVSYFYGETGKQYQVVYFLDGERKTSYLYEEEIEKPTGNELKGFLK